MHQFLHTPRAVVDSRAISRATQHELLQLGYVPDAKLIYAILGAQCTLRARLGNPSLG